MTKPQPIGTCAVIINSQKQVLLGKRKNSYKAGMYGLPGGRIELNELIATAIAREVQEETGIQGLSFTFVGVVRENQGTYDFIHFVFSAQISSQKPMLCEPDKCEGWEWIDITSDLTQVLPGHKAGIEMYKTNEYLADLLQ
jgi:8-oxo-dGTP diphosphatase